MEKMQWLGMGIMFGGLLVWAISAIDCGFFIGQVCGINVPLASVFVVLEVIGLALLTFGNKK